MRIMDYEITKREILVAIIIAAILIGVGLLISSRIENSVIESNENYFKALKINNNNDEFEYALNTNIGYTLAYGKVEAINPVSISDIKGKYFYIQKVKEVYTRHTREVANTRTVSDGNGGYKTETYYTTEEYYTWDYAGAEDFHVDSFKYLGQEFKYGKIKFHNTKYKQTINESYYVRYVYYVIPTEFSGSLFTNIKNNTINDNEFYHNNSIQNVIGQKENIQTIYTTIFWIFWIILSVLIVICYICLENKYLED